MKKKVSFLTVLVVLFSLLSSAIAIAQEADPVATVVIRRSTVLVKPQTKDAGYILTVSGPGDFYLNQAYSPGERFILRTLDKAGNPLPDGVYQYEIRVALPEAPADVDESQRGLVNAARAMVQSGSFSVRDGDFVTQEVTEDKDEAVSAPADIRAPYDQVILDDLIVDGSACIGMDCINGESFGFDTIRLKENNLRIHFQDTSSTASFPTTDWTLVANDSSNGGANYFAIQDRDAGRNVFVVEASAPANSLYVEDYGRVGLGTSTPVVEMHIKDSDTPTVRLEQDSSGGWTPQTWDVAGNESNFFIRDATNGSKLPFRIQPGAPSSALTIKSSGDIGVGTWSPGGAFHIQRTGSNPKLIFERTDAHATMWAFNNASNGLRLAANGTQQFLLDTDGNLTIQGALTQNSNVNVKENFAAVNPREILASVVDLPITSWNFEFDDPSLRHLGPMAQDFYQAFGLGADEEHIAPLDTAGVALAAIQGLNEIVGEKEAQIQTLEARLTALEQAEAGTSWTTMLPWFLNAVLLLAVVGLMGRRLYSVKKSQ